MCFKKKQLLFVYVASPSAFFFFFCSRIHSVRLNVHERTRALGSQSSALSLMSGACVVGDQAVWYFTPIYLQSRAVFLVNTLVCRVFNIQDCVGIKVVSAIVWVGWGAESPRTFLLAGAGAHGAPASWWLKGRKSKYTDDLGPQHFLSRAV